MAEVTVEDFMDGRGEGAREVRRIRFKLYDKRAALVDIGRHLGMFTDKVQLTGKNGGPVQHSNIEPKTSDEITNELAGHLCEMFGIESKEATRAFKTSIVTGLPVKQCV